MPAWAFMTFGLVGGLLAMHLAVGRPVSHELDRMERQLGSLERKVELLVGQTDNATEAAGLLAVLGQQSRQLEMARQALCNVQHLREGLHAESLEMNRSYEALDRLARLRDRVIDGEHKNELAHAALNDIQALQQRLAANIGDAADAEAAFVEMALLQERVLGLEAQTQDAQVSLDEVASLHQSLADVRDESAQAVRRAVADLHKVNAEVSQAHRRSLAAELTLDDLAQSAETAAEKLHDAFAFVADWNHLHDLLMHGRQQMVAAEQSVDDMRALQQQLINQQINTELAAESLATMMELHDAVIHAYAGADLAATHLKYIEDVQNQWIEAGQMACDAQAALDQVNHVHHELLDQTAHLAEMSQRIENLGNLKDRVISQTGDLPDAVQTLEAFQELCDEFQCLQPAINHMRRSLVDFTLLEGQFQKVMQMLAPLNEMVNLHRLPAADLHQAVRHILHRRSERLGQTPTPAAVGRVPTEINSQRD